MERMLYQKTGHGPIVVETRSTDLGQTPETNIDRFNAFFTDVPLWGGQEWRTLEVDEIVSVFRSASVDICDVYRQRREDALREHSSRNPLARWWKEVRGWKAPRVPSEEEIIQDMAARCRKLSNWMRANSSRQFYVGSDMSDFIHKPMAVADLLTA